MSITSKESKHPNLDKILELGMREIERVGKTNPWSIYQNSEMGIIYDPIRDKIVKE